MDEIIDKMEKLYDCIYVDKMEIAELKKSKAGVKASLWEEATGTVDQKKDYIKSKTSEIDYKINCIEANIEHSYNLINVLDYRLVYCDE